MAGALSGVRVIEIGEMVSAPYAARLMAGMGAEVIKIERPDTGDPARTRGPFPGSTPHPEKSGLFLFLNVNKLGVTLDLECAEGFALLEKLVQQCDVLIHNLPPPTMDRLGLDFERLERVNPALVMTTIGPYGLSGPKRNWRAEDLALWAAGGPCALNGDYRHPELPPLKAYGQQAGYQGGVHAAVATMGALMARMRDGKGQYVEVSVQEVLAGILEMTFGFWTYAGLVANRLGQKPVQPLEVMECRDGWIYVCCIEEHQWQSFVTLMGEPQWAKESIFSDRLQRAVNWDALRPLLQEWVGKQSVLDLYRQAQERRIPFAPVSSLGDLVNSEHLRARGFFAEIDHPVAGRWNYPGAPFCPQRTPWQIRSAAPILGQHNRDIFSGRLGLSISELGRLKEAGIV